MHVKKLLNIGPRIRGGVLLGMVAGALSLLPIHTSAASLNITYHYKHFIFVIPATAQSDWRKPQEVWTYNGNDITPPAALRVDGDTVPAAPAGFEKKSSFTYDRAAVLRTINRYIGETLNRDAGSVTISKTSSGKIIFDGVGLSGRQIDNEAAVDATIAAVDAGITDVFLPVTETQPQVTVTDSELRAQGITELVTVGESDFSNSPKNRRHNIAVGLGKFNGHLIPKDSIFSFNQVLGPVDGSTGYLKELVIKGDQTVPDYGGGLCQVSSTAYRGVWEYGFPITQRKNHSYTVSHYLPQGTDATVYPPLLDIKFKNDSPAALLIQTYAEGDLAYFLYYGTKDTRTSELAGPFTWGYVSPPPDRNQPTLDLKPGERKKVGERVPGMSVAWFRTVEKDGKATTQGTYSVYEARPLYYLIGTDKLPEVGSGETVPSVFLDE